jgi:deoxycytidylate deaminase
MIHETLRELQASRLVTTTTRRIDLKHLLSAERAARGSFYATRVGFVAINPKGHRIARAHNGFPLGIRETRDRWSKAQKDFYHLHAECAGVFHALRHGYACNGATAYVTHPPCPGCMQVLIAAGFSKLVFGEQSLLERIDWEEDMRRTFALAKRHNISVMVYQDSERSLKAADITRTELELKKVYDELLPQARWTSADKSAISPPTKPESPEWIEQPVTSALLRAARRGVVLAGAGIIMDYLPECRAATAIIQAGITSVHILDMRPDPLDPRWGAALEVERALEMLEENGKMPILPCESGRLPQEAPLYLDATRDGLKLKSSHLLRLQD